MATQVPDHTAQPHVTLEERLTAAESEVVRLQRELAAALEQQAATSEIMRVITTSPTDAQPVLDAVVRSAVHLSRSAGGTLSIREGAFVRAVSTSGTISTLGGGGRHPMGALIDLAEVHPGTVALLEGRTVHIPDRSTPEFRRQFPTATSGPFATLHVPLLAQAGCIGTISVSRDLPGPHSPQEIALLETFANQAVIAIENARLFEQLDQRNHDLAEALEQQTAMSEILRVIASSPTDLDAVLQTVVEAAQRLGGGQGAAIQRPEGDRLRTVAGVMTFPSQPLGSLDTAADLHERRKTSSVAFVERRTIHVADIEAEADTFPDALASARHYGWCSVVAAPLLQGDQAIGVLSVYGVEPRPFTSRQIQLVESFASQAVIAIENARLFSELEQRNAELQESNRQVSEALDQQTATAEILGAIASAPIDLAHVLDSIIKCAARLCDAPGAALQLIRDDDGCLVPRFSYGMESSTLDQFPPDEADRRLARLPSRRFVSGRAFLDRQTVRVDDLAEAIKTEFPESRERQELVGHRSVIDVPLLSGGQSVGVLSVMRFEVRPFSDREVALLEGFADQAVIALASARLFEELQQRNRALSDALERQTATADVLGLIAASPTDPQPVLDAVVQSVARLSGSPRSLLATVEGDHLRVAAVFGTAPGVSNQVGEIVSLTAQRAVTRAFMDRQTIHIPDLSASADVGPLPDGRQPPSVARLYVPLVRRSLAIGLLTVTRAVAQGFSEHEIELVELFADQAAIAIENARLFHDLAELNHTLEARVGEQVDQLERVGRLRRYLSPQLAEVIVSSGDESILASHRRRISVVFCDLRGFTAFAETEEPEEVMAVLGEYHDALGALIREYDGTFGHFAGDGLMIFFNDPLPQPDHVERAVRMACAMRRRAAGLAQGWRRAGYELGFGIGVAVGYATLGRIGFEGRYDYNVIGTVANLAARLCAEAADGQILIPARLHGMIEHLIDIEPVGELMLKGLHRPVTTFNITSLREDGSLSLHQVDE